LLSVSAAPGPGKQHQVRRKHWRSRSSFEPEHLGAHCRAKDIGGIIGTNDHPRNNPLDRNIKNSICRRLNTSLNGHDGQHISSTLSRIRNSFDMQGKIPEVKFSLSLRFGMS
jgi:hypothetical protein